MRQWTVTVALCGIGLLLSCSKKEKAYDATGTFEATETTVCAEQTGRLLFFSLSEGDTVVAGQEVALTDTSQLSLQMSQLRAAAGVFIAQKPDIAKQVAATREQLATAQRERQRFSELVADGAAPRKQLDDASAQVAVLQKQLDAQLSALHVTTHSLSQQTAATEAQIRQIADALRKCHIKCPTDGTVEQKFVECGEFVTAGKPLFKVADLAHPYLRAYVTSAQLAKVRVGQKVTVFADYGGGERKAYEGKVVWISSQAEFTPKTIVTDDERADLVYAVKIAVMGDGMIKMGMYGEVKF